jgi:hypothetical protein
VNERGDEATEFALRGGREAERESPRRVGKADRRDRDDLALVRKRGGGRHRGEDAHRHRDAREEPDQPVRGQRRVVRDAVVIPGDEGNAELRVGNRHPALVREHAAFYAPTGVLPPAATS